MVRKVSTSTMRDGSFPFGNGTGKPTLVRGHLPLKFRWITHTKRLRIAARARCGGRNVCLAADLSAPLSLRRLTHPQRRVTIDGYTNLISLLSFLILIFRVLVNLSVLPWSTGG